MTETAQNGWINLTGHDPSNANNPKMLRLPETDNRNGKKQPSQPQKNHTYSRRTASQKNKTDQAGRAGQHTNLTANPTRTDRPKTDCATQQLTTLAQTTHPATGAKANYRKR